MDSLVTAAIAVRDNTSVCFMHVNYGQRTEDMELISFKQLCEHYHPEKKLIIDMQWLKHVGGSALTDSNLLIKDHDGEEGVPITYVPYRNANIVSAAVSWAEVILANRIYIGAVEEDSSGYPDCRETFFQNLQLAINTGTKDSTNIELVTPVIHMKKADIVKLGISLKAPFQYSWSCYKNSQEACGVCDSCYLRLKAFREAGVADPISYQKDVSHE